MELIVIVISVALRRRQEYKVGLPLLGRHTLARLQEDLPPKPITEDSQETNSIVGTK